MISVRPCGDRAAIAVLGNTISEKVNNNVNILAEKLRRMNIDGIQELVPTYGSLLINYAPELLPYSTLSSILLEISRELEGCSEGPSRLLHIPCCYGGHFGPDMDFAVRHTGLSKDEIIALHSAPVYKVFMLGFLPGFVYLGGLDPRLELPRLKSPRLAIPRGAVGIGGKQTGVYPIQSPGGWQLLGATPLDFYDPKRAEPILCRAGDRIVFEPISSCDYYDIRQEMLRGTYTVKIDGEA